MERFNSCTLGWGSLGNIWGHDGKTCPIVTVYVHPARYTSEFLTENDTFTVSFYPESCRNALRYMGAHSGRDGDKAAAAGLTPAAMGNSVTYEEANLTFLCKKLYQHQFSKKSPAPRRTSHKCRSPHSSQLCHWNFRRSDSQFAADTASLPTTNFYVDKFTIAR